MNKIQMNKRGVSTLEIAILVTAIGVAVLAMLPYISRGIQGRIRAGVDELGYQYDSSAESYRHVTINTTSNTTMNVTEPYQGVVNSTTQTNSTTNTTDFSTDTIFNNR